MGWQDRDYAKWSDKERRRYYGSGSTHPGRSGRIHPAAGLAALASLAALVFLPFHLSVFHAGGTPAPVPPATISGPSTATFGSNLSLRGTAPPGLVTIEGRYDGGRTWRTLSTVTPSGGTYATQIPLTQRGELSIKILFADGSSATGSVVVR